MDGEAKFWLCVIAMALLAVGGGKMIDIYEKTHAPICVCPEAAK